MSIIEEIMTWAMWEKVAGRKPTRIKLARHHRVKLKNWIEEQKIPLFDREIPNDGKAHIFGMEIVEV